MLRVLPSTGRNSEAADLQGRARSYASLMGAGMNEDRASRLSGLD